MPTQACIHTRPTSFTQVEGADVLVVNKLDLVSADEKGLVEQVRVRVRLHPRPPPRNGRA